MRIKRLVFTESVNKAGEKSWHAEGVAPVDYWIYQLADGSFYAQHRAVSAGQWRAQASRLDHLMNICNDHHAANVFRTYLEDEE